MKGKFHQKHGFTMIEIMVVIVILGVLAGVGAPRLLNYTERVKEKADMMKLYYLRDALNRALIESEVALYQSSFVSGGDSAATANLQKLKDALKSETGVDLFVYELRPDFYTNIQENHSTINSGSEMSKIVGTSGVGPSSRTRSRAPSRRHSPGCSSCGKSRWGQRVHSGGTPPRRSLSFRARP